MESQSSLHLFIINTYNWHVVVHLHYDHVVDLLYLAWMVMLVFFIALIIFRVNRIAANLSNLKFVELLAQHTHSCKMPSPVIAMMFYATKNTERGQ